ncbi:MAG: UPF0280 family protein [Prolixibacteraceae bacterium]|jgi:uncharacterized protein|nr:UPF0280 family protein [Prolixibacteraceae bacterium]MBT6005068.1 UPF0280 family protein [Prolixibacteraceae bacterium]MBT6765763.1 UPF0280 family protein [Prolixibacteraceae bacterium]MBT6998881.1 UPF0280 family protein [Prolixibacteraceae bacterium]MBT7394661.1 UPF0280 family protein [Prolixibacteraceae bacterium]
MNLFQERTYRTQFNSERFTGFEISYLETDLWIGVDSDSFNLEMKELALDKIKSLRKQFDEYIKSEPFFKKSLKPFHPSGFAPSEAVEMAVAAEKAGIGPMSAVAGLFAREIGEEIIQNFSVNELVVENGGDIYVLLKDELILSVFAGESILSERIGLVIPPEKNKLGICTSAGTVGPSLSYGKADAVVVICEDILLADAFATAFGNKVKSPDHVEKVIKQSEKYPEILSLFIICEDKIGIRGEYEMRILK